VPFLYYPAINRDKRPERQLIMTRERQLYDIVPDRTAVVTLKNQLDLHVLVSSKVARALDCVMSFKLQIVARAHCENNTRLRHIQATSRPHWVFKGILARPFPVNVVQTYNGAEIKQGPSHS
jgi:hypothetical protein